MKTVNILGRRVPLYAVAVQVVTAFVGSRLLGATVFGALLTVVGTVLILALFRDKDAR